jgi:tetratricopeptide (TPR) repeat protein
LAAAQLFEANGGSKEQLGAAKFIVGMSLTGELRFREALPYIQRAVELDPGVPEYQTALQNIKGDQHTAEALMKCQESKYDLALQSASTALDILNTSKPDTERIALALYAKAMALAGGGRIDEALDVVKKAVKLAPGNSTYVGATQDLSLAQLQAAHEEKQRALRAKIAALEQERLNLLTMAPPAVGYPMDSGCGKASVDLADASSFLSNAGQSNTVEEAQDLARKAQFAAWDAENAAGQCRCEGGSQASSAAGWAELHAGRASHEDDPEELADLLRKAQSEVDDALQATANCNADESAEENAEEYEEF